MTEKKGIGIKGILAWSFGLLSVVALWVLAAYKDSTMTCKQVEIYIPGSQFFIEQDEIKDIIFERQPIIGEQFSAINLDKLERKIKLNPYIQKAKVYKDLNGVLHVEIEQRSPIVRVFNKINQDFYIDYQGYKMPISSNYASNVVVATGFIDEIYAYKTDTLKTNIGRNLYKTAKYIAKDPFWYAQAQQIFVHENGDMEIIPRVGSQSILIGDADSLEIKFRNLKAFFEQKIPSLGWGEYKSVSAKFAGQIVCEKKNNNQSKNVLDSIITIVTEQNTH